MLDTPALVVVWSRARRAMLDLPGATSGHDGAGTRRPHVPGLRRLRGRAPWRPAAERHDGRRHGL